MNRMLARLVAQVSRLAGEYVAALDDGFDVSDLKARMAVDRFRPMCVAMVQAVGISKSRQLILHMLRVVIDLEHVPATFDRRACVSRRRLIADATCNRRASKVIARFFDHAAPATLATVALGMCDLAGLSYLESVKRAAT